MPLRGIKVIELAGLAPAPFCGMILADFGASVIKVDKCRSHILFLDPMGHGKRSIAINLKTGKGVEIFRKLSNESDIIIDPYRRGIMEKLKLGPIDLMTTNKRLIYARLTGFGQNGPYANMAGHDINFLALSGLLSLFGRYNEKPTPPLNFAADFAGGGLICALGILLALYERTYSNLGQVIDSSMTEGAAYVGSWLYRVPRAFHLNPRGKNILDTGAHFYDTYETKDNLYMAVGAIEPQFYNIFIEKLGFSEDEIPQMINFDENKEKIAAVFKQKTQIEWMNIFDGTDACVTPVLKLEDTPKHVHNKTNKTFTVLEDDTIIPNPVPRLSRTPGASAATSTNLPVPGEHTNEILLQLKYNDEDISTMIKDGDVYQSKQNSKL